MKKLIVVLIVLVAIAVVFWMTRPTTTSTSKIEWPMEGVRSQVANIQPAQVKEIVFDGLIKTRNLTKTDEIAPFLAGLKSAVYPWDPKKGLPNDNMMRITLVLKDSRSIGPFGFSTEKASHAFGRNFAMAWNKTFTPMIPID